MQSAGLLYDFAATFVRAAVMFFAGSMVSHKIWTEDQATTFGPWLVQIMTLALLALGAALYQRVRSRLAVKIALDMPKGSTESELKDAIKESSVFTRPTLLCAASLLVVAFPLSGCSVSHKGKVVNSYDAVQTALEGIQDVEQTTYDSKALAGLTPAVHAKVQRALAKAFDAQIQIGPALKAWRAGDPAPAGITQWLATVNEVVDAIEPLVPQSGNIGQQALKWAKVVLAILEDMNQIVPPRLKALAGS